MAQKHCNKCTRTLPTAGVSNNANNLDGLQHWCRDCHRMRASEAESPETKRRKASSSLYIMRITTQFYGQEPGGVNLDLLFGLKIGRTSDVAERTKTLEAAMPFHMEVLAEFPGAGHLEGAVHAHLKHCRNTDGKGREWFRISLADAMHVIACAVAGTINADDASARSDSTGYASTLAGASSTVDSDPT